MYCTGPKGFVVSWGARARNAPPPYGYAGDLCSRRNILANNDGFAIRPRSLYKETRVQLLSLIHI